MNYINIVGKDIGSIIGKYLLPPKREINIEKLKYNIEWIQIYLDLDGTKTKIIRRKSIEGYYWTMIK
jgi:hypothetical protein